MKIGVVMKKDSSLLKEITPQRIYSFKLLDENAFSCLKVYLLNAELKDYQKFQDWLEQKHAIKGQIDENELGLVFKSAEMSVKMAFYILEFCQPILEYNFGAIDLAKFVIKLHQFIDQKKHRNNSKKLARSLLEIFNLEVSNYRSLSNIASNLSLQAFPEPLYPKIGFNDSFDICQTVLKEMVLFHATSTTLCGKLHNEISLFMSQCNEIAHRATVAMKTIQDITNAHPLEISCLLNAFYKGDMAIIRRMHVDASEVLAVYLRKFKLPETLIAKCNTVKHDINKFHRSLKKHADPSDYRSHSLVKITRQQVIELDSRVSELIKIKQVGQEILINYEQFRRYVQEMPCIIASLLPERSELLSPLFHQYNSSGSPLIAALSDKTLDQNANLQLFSDLSKAMPYQQSKLNVSIYGEGAWHNSEFMSPLCYAVDYAIPAVIRILLENNATVNPVDNRNTPLQRAMKRGNLEVVKLLLEFGARPDMVTDDDRYTALHHAQNAECAGCLIDWVRMHGAKYPDISLPEFIDARDRYGNTPLHRVSQRKVLAFAMSDNSHNPDNMSMKSRLHLELLQVLVDNKADVNAVSHSGNSALHYMLMIHTHQKYDEVNFQTVIAAVKMLVDAGADVNIISREGLNLSPQKPFQIFSPLLGIFDSSYHGGSEAFTRKKISQSYLYKVSEMLVDHGAIIDIFDEKLLTPLIKSILFSAARSVDYLLTKGANPNLRSNKKKPTPLHYAMKKSSGLKKALSEIESIRSLFKAGASPLLLLDTTLVHINALEYCYLKNGSNYNPHPAAVTLFNEWFDFYRSHHVKGLLNVLCHGWPWMNIPNDLIMLFVKHSSENPNQIRLLELWIIRGRQLLKSQAKYQHSSSTQVLTQHNFFSQDAGDPIHCLKGQYPHLFF